MGKAIMSHYQLGWNNSQNTQCTTQPKSLLQFTPWYMMVQSTNHGIWWYSLQIMVYDGSLQIMVYDGSLQIMVYDGTVYKSWYMMVQSTNHGIWWYSLHIMVYVRYMSMWIRAVGPPGWPKELWWRKVLSVRILTMPLAFTIRIPSQKLYDYDRMTMV